MDADKLFVPAEVMDEISPEMRRPLIQRLAPYIHRWDESTIFGMEKLKDHVGYEPFYTFESAVEQTYEWFMSQGLDKQREYDFSEEDSLIARLS